MKMLTKDEIMKADDRPNKIVEVPEWGGSVLVKTMSGFERDKFESSCNKRRTVAGGKIVAVDTIHMKAELLTLTLCDDQGMNMFTEKEIHILNAKNGEVIERLFNISSKLNKLSDEDIKESEKN